MNKFNALLIQNKGLKIPKTFIVGYVCIGLIILSEVCLDLKSVDISIKNLPTLLPICIVYICN